MYVQITDGRTNSKYVSCARKYELIHISHYVLQKNAPEIVAKCVLCVIVNKKNYIYQGKVYYSTSISKHQTNEQLRYVESKSAV